jgi:Fur family ferric uptake transcriptional regulator
MKAKTSGNSKGAEKPTRRMDGAHRGVTRHEQALELLRGRGFRLTPQRVLVLQALAESDAHQGVEAIYQRVRKAYPYIDVATVYRSLQLLKRLHLVTEVEIGGSSHYEFTPEGGHHHLVCQDCGRAFNLSPIYLERLAEQLSQEFGFTPDFEHMTIAGRCADCAKKVAKAKAEKR